MFQSLINCLWPALPVTSLQEVDHPSPPTLYINDFSLNVPREVILTINNNFSVTLHWKSMCKSIPAIHQFRPIEEKGFEWEPFINPVLIPISITWNPNESQPDYFTKSQGPKLSYKIFIGDKLFMKNDNCPVVITSNGGSWSRNQQTAEIAKNQYRLDSIKFHYRDGKLYPYYFSFCDKNDIV